MRVVLHADRPRPDGFVDDVPAEAQLLVATQDAETVGAVVLRPRGPVVEIASLWVRPDRRGRRLGRALFEAVRRRLRAAGRTTATVQVTTDDPAAVALVRSTRLLGEYMTKLVGAGAPLPPGYGYRPMTPAEFDPWLEAHVASYAAEGLARSGGDPVHALERSWEDFTRFLPDGLDTPDSSIVIVTVDGTRVGDLWLGHHRPGGETFGFDLEIVPARRREGHGRAAMAVAERLAVEAGDTLLGLHVFGRNTGARRLYASEGFRTRSATYDVLSAALDR